MRKMAFLLLTGLFVLVYFGFYIYNNGNDTYYGSVENVSFSYDVSGCAKTDRGMGTKSFGDRDVEPTIYVKGDEVVYYRALNHMCCRKVDLYYDVEGMEINIYENWTGTGCKCICFSEIEGKLKGLGKGKYRINVYEAGTEPASGKDMEKKLIFKSDVKVG